MEDETGNKLVIDVPAKWSNVQSLEGKFISDASMSGSLDIFGKSLSALDSRSRVLRVGFDPSPSDEELMSPELSQWHSRITNYS